MKLWEKQEAKKEAKKVSSAAKNVAKDDTKSLKDEPKSPPGASAKSEEKKITAEIEITDVRGYQSVPTNVQGYQSVPTEPPAEPTGKPTDIESSESTSLVAPSTDERKCSCTWWSFLLILFVEWIGDAGRILMLTTLWPLVSSFGGSVYAQGWVVSAFCIGRFVTSPYFGAVVSSWGCRTVLLIANLLVIAGCYVYAVAATREETESVVTGVHLLFVAQLVIGAGSGTLGVTRAYVASISTKNSLIWNLAILTGVQYAGFMVTPVFARLLCSYLEGVTYPLPGWLPDVTQYTAPAYVLAGFALFAFILLFFWCGSNKTVCSYMGADQAPQYTVLIPDGISEGQHFQANIGGKILNVRCPKDRKSGDSMIFHVPQPSAQHSVQIPEGVRPGQSFPSVVGNQILTLYCSDGIAPGEWMVFRNPGEQVYSFPFWVLALAGPLVNAVTAGTLACYDYLGSIVFIDEFLFSQRQLTHLYLSAGIAGLCIYFLFGLWVKKFPTLLNIVYYGNLLMFISGLMIYMGNDDATHLSILSSIFILYSVGYPAMHLSVIVMYLKIVGKKTNTPGAYMGWFAALGSVARIAFPPLAGYVATMSTKEHIFGIPSLLNAVIFVVFPLFWAPLIEMFSDSAAVAQVLPAHN